MTEDAVVVARGVSREFRIGEATVAAVRPCDAQVRAGELVAIVGKSGSGKSTLCHLLSGIDRPTTGSVSILGRDLAGLSTRELAELRARHLGFVLQRDNLVPWLTIEENVAAPLMFAGTKRKAALAAARDALDRVGLADRARSWPTLVSGGEAQRAAVVRACIAGPTVVFADEPTGALDRQNGATVRELFRKLVSESGAAGVLVTHDPDVAADADAVWHMSDGVLDRSGGAR
ncbi:ATP-binding cassette domain-containing protein [Nocardia puris]|uniref:ABC transporter ATP-binding protein n=1 Tax=Nocardia puris TaxID=208602 RepID=UPI0018945006|nr:ATP-binding cassette domain-containing protein [Nocardia puris]MBF6364670.1 ATP-binding cassette domain-containing protein [Nocardia puris]MBF6463098.1 ATP-binding cassette domain-containing protein [Nocardia puris]